MVELQNTQSTTANNTTTIDINNFLVDDIVNDALFLLIYSRSANVISAERGAQSFNLVEGITAEGSSLQFYTLLEPAPGIDNIHVVMDTPCSSLSLKTYHLFNVNLGSPYGTIASGSSNSGIITEQISLSQNSYVLAALLTHESSNQVLTVQSAVSTDKARVVDTITDSAIMYICSHFAVPSNISFQVAWNVGADIPSLHVIVEVQ